MIELIESATERTTAATDLILAVECLMFAIFFIKPASNSKPAAASSSLFLLLARTPGAYI